jgi:hypothetical protein
MTIATLDDSQRLPVPRLRDGKLDASALTTWLRETADASARRAASDWQRAAQRYREGLAAELRGRVDRV